MKLLLCLACLVTGCARFHVVQTDKSPGEREIETRITGTAWFSSAQTNAGIKALQTDKTQSFGTSQLKQQGATNLVELFNALARIAEAARPTP